MSDRVKRATEAHDQRAAAAPLTRLLSVWLILFLGFFQAGVAGHAAAALDRPTNGLAELSSAIGQRVILCAHAQDRPGAPSDPSHDGDACDHCPLCQLAHLADLVIPSDVVGREREATRLPPMRAWAEVRLHVRLSLVRGRSRAPPVIA